MTPPLPAACPAFLAGGGEMAQRIAAFDWARTPLGAIATWPAHVKTVTSLVLRAQVPMVAMWGPQGVMVYNQGYAIVAGERHPGLLGSAARQAWPETGDFTARAIDTVLAGESLSFRSQVLTLHRHGHAEQVWFDLDYSPVLDDAGQPCGVLAVVMETTQRVEVERKLDQERAQLQELFMQMPGMVGVLRGPDHVFEIANERLRELHGHRPLVGRTVRDALPEIVEQGFADLLDRVYASGEPYAGKAIPAKVALRGGGQEQRYFDFTYQPVRNELGQVTGIFSQGLDVTEPALAMQKLQRSEQLFRVMADVVPQIIWICDNEGRNEFFNQQWRDYTGHTHEATAAEVASRFVHPDDQAETLRRFDEARRRGTPFRVEHRIRRADGEYRWFLVRAAPLHDPDTGQVVRWFGSSTDIGALKAAEQALQDADRRKDEFLATLAHELRNPLAPVSNAIAILRSPQAQGATRTRMLDLMERQTRHLVRLVDDLLEVSRITRGKIELRPERLDLRAIAQASLDAAAAAIQEARHQVGLHLPAAPVWVQADPARMKQVMDNLLNNAIKYTPSGGRVDVEVGQAEDQATLRVADNGAGIPPEMLGRVFDLFAQVDHTIGRAKGGLGIGLALVRQLVLLHGGEVAAHSGGIDTGATFTVRLPLAQAEPAATEAGTGDRLAPTAQPRRVLVVDDNRDAADTLAAAIGLCGHRVETAYDGASGLAAAERLKPDCILLDVGMPGMDGHQVARALRTRPQHAGCTIVAVTGWGQSADRAMTRASGFDAHLVKPVPIESVVALLDGLGTTSSLP